MKPGEFLMAAILVLALLGAMATCDPGSGSTNASTSGSVHCVVMADSPAEAGSAGKINGTARFYCENPGAKLSLTVRLQKQTSGGDWRDVTSQSFNVSAKASLRTDSERYQTRTVAAACSAGTFRTVVSGNSTANSKTTKFDHTSPRATDPC